MFSTTKSTELDEEQRQDAYVNKRHYGKDVKFYRNMYVLLFIVFECVPICVSLGGGHTM